MPDNSMVVLVKMQFRHNCDDWPDGFDKHITFIEGLEYTVPAEVGEYFIRAGWCCKPEDDETWEPPEKNTTAILPNNSVLGHSSDDA